MTIAYRKPTVTLLALAISSALGLAGTATAETVTYTSPLHTFSVNDVQGDFLGSTYGSEGATEDKAIICGLPDSTFTDCPADAEQPFTDKSGVTLYPVDTEFGFYVVDFVGAQEKALDGDYGEGWVGNLPDGSGIAVSNAITDRFKVKAPQGTWCQGLGGNSVKCSTEHYTVMEHVLSCHEVIPYFYADPEDGEQGIQATPDGSLSVDCTDTDLDDEMIILVGGVPTTRLTDSTPGVQMDANDNTSVLDDIAVSADYSLTLKDDGKALYRWGALIKRPNDVRMYARLALPDEWKDPGADFPVTKAWLVVNHTITNNPNDQLRPEDLENEAAIGVLPDHTVENEGTVDEVWKSTKLCYEGDGDIIDTEEGSTDPTVIGIGTYLRNMPFAVTGAPGVPEPGAAPYPFSADLTKALTNAWYTTLDREPFEWSYVIETVSGDVKTVDYRGCPGPIEDPAFAGQCTNVPAGTPLFSGPRWRLKPNKFGQDLPGLEIPVTAALEEPCTPPPYEKALIKYEVGSPSKTVINLLDWNEEENGPSPLSTSKGWVDSAANNEFITIVDEINGRQITTNGLPMSDDFDLAVYIKGDRKPTFVYNAQLIVEYEGGTPPEPNVVDMRLANLLVPARIGRNPDNRTQDLSVTACNDSSDYAASGSITLEGVSLTAGVEPAVFALPFNGLAPLTCVDATFTWTAPTVGTSISWTAEVAVTPDLVDPDPTNNTATATTLVYPLR
jgi:hypothetical protein